MINAMVMMMIKTTMMWMMMMVKTMVIVMTKAMVTKSMLIADNLLKKLEKGENSLNVWKGK